MTRKPWNECELPILEALRDVEDRGDTPRHLELARSVGLDDAEAVQVFDDLFAERFVTADHRKKDGSGRYAIMLGLRLAPNGRRRLGLWPPDEASAERFISAFEELLDAKIASSQRPEDRSVLERLKEAIKDAPAAVLTALLVGAAGRIGGAP
jgi:hypothetical protein